MFENSFPFAAFFFYTAALKTRVISARVGHGHVYTNIDSVPVESIQERVKASAYNQDSPRTIFSWDLICIGTNIFIYGGGGVLLGIVIPLLFRTEAVYSQSPPGAFLIWHSFWSCQRHVRRDCGTDLDERDISISWRWIHLFQTAAFRFEGFSGFRLW